MKTEFCVRFHSVAVQQETSQLYHISIYSLFRPANRIKETGEQVQGVILT
jgi:hypothetical protein